MAHSRHSMPGYHHLVPPGQTHLRPYVDEHAAGLGCTAALRLGFTNSCIALKNHQFVMERASLARPTLSASRTVRGDDGVPGVISLHVWEAVCSASRAAGPRPLGYIRIAL